jgi:hypothetical protein
MLQAISTINYFALTPPFLTGCRQYGSYPETGLEEINVNLLKEDFWTTSR